MTCYQGYTIFLICSCRFAIHYMTHQDNYYSEFTMIMTTDGETLDINILGYQGYTLPIGMKYTLKSQPWFCQSKLGSMFQKIRTITNYMLCLLLKTIFPGFLSILDRLNETETKL